jgi:glycolate oxidase iron-sulfur subunit
MPDWANEIHKCTSCGLCAAVCPSYQEDRREINSPRGRVHLMARSVEVSEFRDMALSAIRSCVGCNACSMACPTGVDVSSAWQEWSGSMGSVEQPGV